MLRSTSRRLSLAFVAAGIIASCGTMVCGNQIARAVSASSWKAGNIISDGEFFNPSSMTAADIQNFLNSQVPSCDTQGTRPYGNTTRAAYSISLGYPPPYTCLKDYTLTTSSRDANSACQAISGGTKTASQIIYDAATACGINPKVLLVMLQKEQSLVTDDWPWSLQYRGAMGYGCPDTAPCDAQYYGLYNQVYNAARQLKLYAINQNSYRYRAFQSNYILWHPNEACGGSNVQVETLGTSGLYNYTPYQPNQAALNNLYGMGDSCSAYGNRNFWRLYNDWFGSTSGETFLVIKSYVNTLGWTSTLTNGGITGTTGQSKSLEAFKIHGQVEYSAYDVVSGWQPTVSYGMIAGTTGQNRPIGAIKINPLGSVASLFDVYYRVHVSNVGWMGWVKNGHPAGVTGDATKNIEAIEIRLSLKNSTPPGTTTDAYRNLVTTPVVQPPVSLWTTSYVNNNGWQPGVTSGMESGLTDYGNRYLEGLSIHLTNTTGKSGSIIYSAYVSGVGWQNFSNSGELGGIVGQGRKIEAIRIALTGEIGTLYDVWYRGYVDSRGDTAWAKNSQPAGSVGINKPLQSITVLIAPKGSLNFTGPSGFYNPNNQPLPSTHSLSYSSYSAGLGWLGVKQQGVMSGTSGQAGPLLSLRIEGVGSIFGDLTIECSSYIRDTGWIPPVSTKAECRSAASQQPIEAFKLTLKGTVANQYDIYYQAYLSWTGWQGWVKNGETAGTPQTGKQVEGMVIVLVPRP